MPGVSEAGYDASPRRTTITESGSNASLWRVPVDVGDQLGVPVVDAERVWVEDCVGVVDIVGELDFVGAGVLVVVGVAGAVPVPVPLFDGAEVAVPVPVDDEDGVPVEVDKGEADGG